MANVFVSYRRSDSSHATGRIYDRLVAAFGREHVFKDVDSIPLGSDFRKHIDASVAACNLMIAVIGPQWKTATDQHGCRRLDDPADFVRVEIESALTRDIRIIPLLLENTPMPTVDDLPPQLRDFAFRHATHVRNDPDFHTDMDRVVRAIEADKAEHPKQRVKRSKPRRRKSSESSIPPPTNYAITPDAGKPREIEERDQDSEHLNAFDIARQIWMTLVAVSVIVVLVFVSFAVIHQIIRTN